MNYRVTINIYNCKNDQVSKRIFKKIAEKMNHGQTEGTIVDDENQRSYYWDTRMTP